jgi:hypothetical protein
MGRVGWPLQLVITHEALAMYKRLFSLLFRLKRLSHEVCYNCWMVCYRWWDAG